MCSEDLQHRSFGNMTIQYSFIIQEKMQDLPLTKFAKSNYLLIVFVFFRLLIFRYIASNKRVRYISELYSNS